jgi:outer membrane protein
MRKFLTPSAALLVLLLCARPAFAQETLTLSLDQAIATALARNPGYRAAIASVRVRADDVRAARGDRGPTLTVSDAYTSSDPVAQLSTPFGPLPFGPNATNLPLVTARYTLFDDGAGAARAGRADAGYAAAAASEREARGALIAGVTQAYVDDLAAAAASEAADAAVAGGQRSYEDTQARFAAGTVPRFDVLEARTELADLRVRAIDARGLVTIAHERLATLLGLPATTHVVTSDKLETKAAVPAVDALVASAIAQRGELQAARAALDAAEASIREAKAENAPSVGIAVSDGNVQPAVQPGYTNQFVIALQGVWRLYDGGATAARIAAARDAYAQAQAEYDRLRAQAELDVREGFVRLQTAAERVEAARDLAASAAEDERLAEIRYRGQVGTQLELRDAQARNASARQQLIRAQADLRIADAHLRFVAGIDDKGVSP